MRPWTVKKENYGLEPYAGESKRTELLDSNSLMVLDLMKRIVKNETIPSRGKDKLSMMIKALEPIENVEVNLWLLVLMYNVYIQV